MHQHTWNERNAQNWLPCSCFARYWMMGFCFIPFQAGRFIYAGRQLTNMFMQPTQVYWFTHLQIHTWLYVKICHINICIHTVICVHPLQYACFSCAKYARNSWTCSTSKNRKKQEIANASDQKLRGSDFLKLVWRNFQFSPFKQPEV